MMTNEERTEFCKAMKNLSHWLATTSENIFHEDCNGKTRFDEIMLERVRNLADIYLKLSRANLFRETDPDKISSEILEQLK